MGVEQHILLITIIRNYCIYNNNSILVNDLSEFNYLC